MRSAKAGKPPPRRRRKSLSDAILAALQRPDPTPAPKIDLRRKLHPIRHSSPN